MSQHDNPPEDPNARAARLRREANAKRTSATRLTGVAEAASERAAGMYGRFAGGQPLLVGHHSYKGAVRDRTRADNATRHAIEQRKDADRKHWQAVRAEHKADMAEKVAARTRPWGPGDFVKGDIVTVRTFETHEDTYRVKRVNKKSLTLDGGGGGWDDPRREYDRVLSRTRDGITITDPSQIDTPEVNQ
ncbi:DUF3560 domain-containing protein [Streptomyces albidoflavus]|uniref:DUF3560 domain-containing protein n=1 Tax=Streptomyces albidoflavus TaxID=1886 RepID=UPI0013EE8EB7|nr:DUF3560 domain-containing protein [Streptomyces albidoflavus]